MQFLLLFLLVIIPVWADDCQVNLRVLNVDGTPGLYAVDSFKDEKGVEFSKQFSGLRGPVPCQLVSYSFVLKRISASDWVRHITRVEGRMWATKAETWLTVSTDPAIYVSPDGQRGGFINSSYPMGFLYWKGRVLPLPTEKLWIHMRSVVPTGTSPGEVEAELDDAGEFRIYKAVFEGPYIVYVTNPQGEIIHSELIRMKSKLPAEEFVISLPAQPPSLRPVQ